MEMIGCGIRSRHCIAQRPAGNLVQGRGIWLSWGAAAGLPRAKFVKYLERSEAHTSRQGASELRQDPLISAFAIGAAELRAQSSDFANGTNC